MSMETAHLKPYMAASGVHTHEAAAMLCFMVEENLPIEIDGAAQ